MITITVPGAPWRRRAAWRAGLAAALLNLAAAAAAEEFKFVVQPVYPPERAREVYTPLVEYLTRVTEHTFELVTPRDFHRYWIDMRRQDDWHFVLDDAHFTDYRIQRFDYQPLARTAENESFTLVGGSTIMTDESLDDLVARRIVTMPAPSLGSAFLSDWYRNPLRQPTIVSSALSWRDTVEIVFAGEAEAAVLPTWLAQRYPNLLPMATTEEVPGPAISAAPTVATEARAAVRAALLALHEDNALYEVLVELNVSRFVPTSAQDYAGHGELLADFYGY